MCYLQLRSHWQGEEQLTAAGWTVSLVWMVEAGVEAVGGGRVGVGALIPEEAGGEEEAWLHRCYEAGRA